MTELCTKCVLMIKVDVIICNQMEERHMDDKTQAERDNALFSSNYQALLFLVPI